MKNYPNLLSLDQFSDVLGLDPWLVSQVGKNSGGNCGCCVFENSYRDKEGKFSRRHMAQAILSAEEMIARVLGYYPAPKWFPASIEDAYDFPLPIGRYEPIPDLKLQWGYLQAIGTPVLTALDTVAVTKRDSAEQGFNDAFVATITVPAGTTPDQLEVYFTEDDRDDEPLEDWQIRPVSIKVTGTTATLRGPLYLLAKPMFMRKAKGECLDASSANTYVTEVEVYRRTIDTCQQGSLIWADAGDCATEDCLGDSEPACFEIVSGHKGIVIPKRLITCDGSTRLAQSLHRDDPLPKRATVYYLAGYPLKHGLMDTYHAQIVTWLAASMMVCEDCPCHCVKDIIADLRTPPIYKGGQDNGDKLLMTASKLGDGFGIPRQGAIQAWNQLQAMVQNPSVAKSF